MAEATAAPPPAVELDEQDPLPESNWFFRRICLLGTLALQLFQRLFGGRIEWHGHSLINAPDRWTDYIILTVLVLYTVAPSAEQVSKMIATVSLFGPGRLSMTRTQNTTATNNEASGQATTTIGPAPRPPVLNPQAGGPVITHAVADLGEGELPPEQRVPRPVASYQPFAFPGDDRDAG